MGKHETFETRIMRYVHIVRRWAMLHGIFEQLAEAEPIYLHKERPIMKDHTPASQSMKNHSVITIVNVELNNTVIVENSDEENQPQRISFEEEEDKENIPPCL